MAANELIMHIVPLQRNTEIVTLLKSCGLSVEDLHENSRTQFFGLSSSSGLAGVIGVEHYGTYGLIRSLAVHVTFRSEGIGRMLVKHAEQWAKKQGMTELFLLTTTASGFFSRLGYTDSSRSDAPEAIQRTPQFSSLCPSSSQFMHKLISA